MCVCVWGVVPSAAAALHNEPCFLAMQSFISHFTTPTRSFSSLRVSLLLLRFLVSVARFLWVLFGFLLL